jgi:hypothetical protein
MRVEVGELTKLEVEEALPLLEPNRRWVYENKSSSDALVDQAVNNDLLQLLEWLASSLGSLGGGSGEFSDRKPLNWKSKIDRRDDIGRLLFSLEFRLARGVLRLRLDNEKDDGGWDVDDGLDVSSVMWRAWNDEGNDVESGMEGSSCDEADMDNGWGKMSSRNRGRDNLDLWRRLLMFCASKNDSDTTGSEDELWTIDCNSKTIFEWARQSLISRSVLRPCDGSRDGSNEDTLLRACIGYLCRGSISDIKNISRSWTDRGTSWKIASSLTDKHHA